jgi:electron transport complex protein RnfG
MVGINMESDAIISVGVTTHAETPGLGSKAKDDPGFAAQFAGISAMEPVKVNKDGGTINSISGATITSRAVTSAATDVNEIYQRMKPQLIEQANSFGK